MYIRSKILFFLILLFASIIFIKLFFLQILHGDYYSELANRQYITPSYIFERGDIFFESKDGTHISAATQITKFKVAINPSKIVNLDLLYKKLSDIISVPINKDKFYNKNSNYVEITKNISKEEADKITALKIPNVFVYKEKLRFYPGGFNSPKAAQTLGFVGYNGNELTGRYGLEKYYDDILSRSKDSPNVNFFAEVFSNIQDKFLENSTNSDGNLITTIEPIVQSVLEKKLLEVKEKYTSSSAGGVIMNPQDGSIYAIAFIPDFNPNNFSKVENISVFVNPFVENVFEFGSVVKPLIMAAAIDAGAVTPETTYQDNGFVIIEKKRINNFDKKGRGLIDMKTVLAKSLNTGMVFVYKKLGKEKIRDYLFGYGINTKTGIDLPNESNNLISNLQSPRELEYANASFGQGIAITPINLIRALASLANGGNLITPHIVKKISYNSGVEKEMIYAPTRAKISKETSKTITEMLVNIMDTELRGGKAKMDNYSIAVKTGTAQIAKENESGYYDDRNIHSFFGYFPAYNPKFLVFFFTIDPKGTKYASETWTDPFLDITKFLLNYYEISPDRQ